MTLLPRGCVLDEVNVDKTVKAGSKENHMRFLLTVENKKNDAIVNNRQNTNIMNTIINQLAAKYGFNAHEAQEEADKVLVVRHLAAIYGFSFHGAMSVIAQGSRAGDNQPTSAAFVDPRFPPCFEQKGTLEKNNQYLLPLSSEKGPVVESPDESTPIIEPRTLEFTSIYGHKFPVLNPKGEYGTWAQSEEKPLPFLGDAELNLDQYMRKFFDDNDNHGDDL